VIAVPKVDTKQVALDAAVLRSVDAAAERLGSSREEVLEDSVRRGLAARVLGDVLARVRAGGAEQLNPEQAYELGRSELLAARAERREEPAP
jgi:hypothetical protein